MPLKTLSLAFSKRSLPLANVCHCCPSVPRRASQAFNLEGLLRGGKPTLRGEAPYSERQICVFSGSPLQIPVDDGSDEPVSEASDAKSTPTVEGGSSLSRYL